MSDTCPKCGVEFADANESRLHNGISCQMQRLRNLVDENAALRNQLADKDREIARLKAYIDLVDPTGKVVAKPTSTKGERD